MLHNTIQAGSGERAAACPYCDNEELTEGDYCMICGLRLPKQLLAAQREEVGHALQEDPGQ